MGLNLSLSVATHDNSMTEEKDGIIKQNIKLPGDCDNGRLAFVLLNVFTKEECQAYIDLTEAKGYIPALTHFGRGVKRLVPHYRNNDHCIIDSVEIMSIIWQRVRSYIPKEWNNNYQILSLNECLRFLRYDVGQRFEAHVDSAYRRKNRSHERSFLTIQVCLNEGFQGGATTFIDPGGPNPKADMSYIPKQGMVLAFEHCLLHEESALISGRKYTIPTDVMYKPKQMKKKNIL
ncbi:unnamed protein product [Didymodactylos carnosus]|uniref:Prolyl 4-hydroxylase alpha subunit domain-containing protein n=1 Tax=Didymodactylos carnosus TaxID=1234261 RepID=A0A8S2ST74_9BILA|nr:unnamed protein product [Didymodactylos carnosus]CAF4219120.1 unnamed protein product [Didymodactylos carnosus]